MPEKKTNPKDYVWIITESKDAEETFLGISSRDSEPFLPVTREKEDMEALLRRLPPAAMGVIRQVEAIHQEQIRKEAGDAGFVVRLVDSQGRVLSDLGVTMQ